ncbi:hypothetical protein DPMN_091760 [Dreissena polymorpha]|uniref:Uncharacterized protein n=1 Tax=Dreissena polymorpha TaxID=45954 RepID=A0A9D4QZE1_DREPO|nr:hypothetical protein DPMN_091760 [Dreissena polymorpha]
MCPGFYRGAYASIYVIKKNASPPCHVFKTTGTIFELVREIIGTHCLTKFHEDRAINVASRVLKSFFIAIYRHIRKNAPPLDIIGTTVLTKFHEDWTIYVASKVLTSQILTPHNTLRTTDKR